MNSPLSPLPAEKIRDLPRDFLLAKLAEYFHATPPGDIVATDYSLWRCSETGLEFCHPALPGSAEFYEWASRSARYYFNDRWEFGEVARRLRAANLPATGQQVLDVGSGPGDFLRELDFVPAQSKFALDLNESAVQACREQKFNAFCGAPESALAAGFVRAGQFAVVTAFHLLEHVADPVGFVRGLLRLTAPGGKLFLSTPASPMSFEREWFDVMNHPPHHMTRWNRRSYQKLAEILGLKMECFTPVGQTLSQLLQTFKLKNYGANVEISRLVLLQDIALHAGQVWADWRWLCRRAAGHDLGGADLILVEFTAP